MSCARLAAHPRDERDTMGVCCGHRRQRRGPKGEGDGRCLVARFLREHWRRGQRRQRGETRGGFLPSDEVFVRELPLAGARRWKGDALAPAARRCFFEAGGGELARGGGEDGRAWALVDAAKNRGLGTCLACTSARLQVWSSAGKPSAGGGALPKKGQGRRRFVSSGLSVGCLYRARHSGKRSGDLWAGRRM
ncbi:hypothetical protein B0H14DRAFT_3587993 [Mycena olivaceomarginata]|nr:hypothetical protein B0H14DRAFT_3587993 [Mycena olivaceomarginata]